VSLPGTFATRLSLSLDDSTRCFRITGSFWPKADDQNSPFTPLPARYGHSPRLSGIGSPLYPISRTLADINESANGPGMTVSLL